VRFAANNADGQVRDIEPRDVETRDIELDAERAVLRPISLVGQLGVARPRPRRRRRSILKHRRPSILLRRAFIKFVMANRVHRDEREIIARD
jgi:hypothetical protein